MARIRTVKPEFWQNEQLAMCSPYARLLAIAVLQLADSAGRMRWIPMQVHAHAFPFESDLDIEDLTQELENTGYIIRYQVNGRTYAEIPNFLKHQRLTGKEAQITSAIPHRETPGKHPDASRGSDKETPGKHLDAQEREREREREEEQGKENTSSGQSPSQFVSSFILDDKTEYLITKATVDEYRRTYPLVDTDKVLREIRQWCKDNPAKRKTRRGAAKFLNSWLSRAQKDAEDKKPKNEDPVLDSSPW